MNKNKALRELREVIELARARGRYASVVDWKQETI
jgi:hypothetical protein